MRGEAQRGVSRREGERKGRVKTEKCGERVGRDAALRKGKVASEECDEGS